MTRARRRADGPAALFPVPAAAGRRRKGRVEVAVDKAVAAGYRDEVVSPKLDAGMVALARTLAGQLDEAARTMDPWALSRVSGELRAVLGQLRLDPTSRGGLRRDEFADLVASLARPTVTPADEAVPADGEPAVPHPA